MTVVTLWRGAHKDDFPWGPGGKPIKATGKPIALVGMNILRLAGGKIVEEWESLNNAALFQQLGAI